MIIMEASIKIENFVTLREGLPVLGHGHFGNIMKRHYFFEKSSYVLLAIM